MGLDTTHDCWSGPYSAFMRWRKAIARAAGFPPLEIMDGFYVPSTEPPLAGSWAENLLIRQYHRAGRLPIRWEELGDHVGDRRLVPLLTHSDCDGELSVEECGPIADALEELLPKLAVGDRLEPRADYDGARAAAERFVKGLRLAVSRGEPVRFH